MKHLYDKIDSFYLLDIKNPTHPSIFIEEEAYDILIITLPNKEDELKMESYAFVFDQQSCYYFDKSKDEFEDFETMQKVYEFLNDKTNHLMKMVAQLHDSVDVMEEKLYDNEASNFMHYWLATKKDLGRIHRMLNLGVEVLNTFILSYLKEEDFLAIHFKDILEHLSRTSRLSFLAMDKLNNLYSFYTSRSNEKMNKTIYLLTIFSGIFLPLNLMVGYFGMNTLGLPFTGIANASTWVTWMLLSCAVGMSLTILWFKKRL
ncbi:MAG: CorA family divalent cation transporter [Sulfurospirillaceae bacterium]|nr:CorA family divalent cation transporter [Sulfurospirillaceae bacterium]MDD2825973.1 CorA family divalent cation transporter [Sulfurospirillaceae bacterium]